MRISARGGKGKVYLSYNGSNEDMLEWKGDRDVIRAKLGWADKFIVVYAGLIGLGQNLTELPGQIAEISDKKIQLVFIGDGPKKSALANRVAEMNLSNVTFLDLMAREEIIAYTHAADALLVVLIEADFFKSAIPSKFFDCMAAGRPVISNVNGELRDLMDEHQTGMFFSFNEKGSFKKAIEELKGSFDLRERLGKNGRRIVKERFLRSKTAADAVKRIEAHFDIDSWTDGIDNKS